MVWWTGFFRAVDPYWMCVLALLWRCISFSIVYFFFWVRSNQKCWTLLSSAEPIALNNGLNMWRAADERLLRLQSEWMFWKPQIWMIRKAFCLQRYLFFSACSICTTEYAFELVLWNSGGYFRFRIMSVALVFQISLEVFWTCNGDTTSSAELFALSFLLSGSLVFVDTMTMR